MSSRHSRNASPRAQIHDTPGAFPSSPESEEDPGVVSLPQSLSLGVKARRAEYVKKRTIKVKVGTWNVAAMSGTDMDIGAWFVEGKGVKGLEENLSGLSMKDQAATDKVEESIESVEDQEMRQTKKQTTVPKNDVPGILAGKDIGLYVLGLQEIVDINSASEALRPFTDPNPAKKWKAALEKALPQGYKIVAEQQMSGVLLLVYASPEVAASVDQVSTTSVGTGLMGYMRNKGAVCGRLVLGETTRFVFINCHLAAGTDKAALDRRNWDAGQIESRIRFAPMTDSAEVVEEYGDAIGDEDFGFWFGDLNYRLDDIPGDDVRRLLLLHTRNEYDVNNKSKRKIDSELGYVSADHSSLSTEADQTSQHSRGSKDSSDDEVDDLPLDPKSDPASLHTTLQSLLPHDQLRDQQKKYRAFHDGWREGEINFLPTYKYDVGSVGMFDSGDKKRGPSWCDRILYRTRQDRLEAERRRREEDEAKKRDAEMKDRGLDKPDEDVIFDSDPGTPGFPGTPGYAPEEYDEEEDVASESELEPGRNGSDEAISLEHYGSHQRILSSDHKPLDAIFSITYEAAIPELKAKVQQEVARELDKQENEGRPGVTVVVDHQPEAANDKADDPAEHSEIHGVDFGEIRYGTHKSAGLTVANTGGVVATFLFVDRPVVDDHKASIAPPWLTLEVEGDSDNANTNRNALQQYTLLPGETRYVHLAVEIQDFKLVRKLNEGTLQLDDVLVLRVKDGRDHFIPLFGSWMQSSFCRTLNELLSVPEGGVRQLQRQKSESGAKNNCVGSEHNPPQHQKLSAPRELYALSEVVQDLAQRGVAEWEMTHEDGTSQPPWKQESWGNGWPFEPQAWEFKPSPDRSRLLADVREALDTGALLNAQFAEESPTFHRLEVLAETLVTFLRSLQDGIITADLWDQLDSHMNTTSKSGASEADQQSWILEILSSQPAHNVTFTFITFMLARTANEIAPLTNKLPQTEATLSSSHSTTPPPPTSPSPQSRHPVSLLPSAFRRNHARTTTSASGEDPPAATSETATRRQAVEQAYADIFADALIRKPPSMKDRKATREKMRRVVLPFLREGP